MGGEVEQEVSEVITMAVDKFAATENWEVKHFDKIISQHQN